MRRKNIFFTLLVTAILCAGPSCENLDSDYNYRPIWRCHYENNWSYESTKNKIIGRWEWKYMICCGETSRPYQSSTESRGFMVEFNPDGTGAAMDKSSIRAFTWDVRVIDNDLYGFQITPPISQLNGQLLFCDDIMMCNDSYIDGADHFLKKIEKGE